MHRLWIFVLALAAGVSFGCKKSSEVSVEQAREHARFLQKTIKADVEEVRAGLPQGAKHLVELFQKESLSEEDAQAARGALEDARDTVQDLRIAKSTFFAAVRLDGLVLRNDREQDLMVGKNIFKPFPELKQAVEGKYVEARGSMPEAAGVRGRPDGQWVAASPVRVGGEVKGLYVTGWSWAAYCYRLENALRSKVRADLEERAKMPLLYVYVVVDKQVFGAPVAPQVNADAIAEMDPLAKASENEPFSAEREITGRSFGLAVILTPVLGPRTAVAVLRSET
jgi:hypothetical protein